MFCSPHAKSHHRVIPNALAIAIDHRKSWHHHRRCIGKIDKISIRNLYPIDKLANILNERFIVHINRATRCTVKPLQTIVKRCPRTPPIARSLVAAPVLWIRIDKMIHRLHRLKHRSNPTRLIGLHQQSRSQPIRHNPRIPIVHARTRIPHPAKIFPLQQRRQNAILHLTRNARHNQRRNRIELRAEQIHRPRQQFRRLCGKQIDNRLGRIRQATTRLLHANMRGHTPERLLANTPDTIGNIIQKSPFPLHAFCQNQIGQRRTPPKTQALVSRAIAIARIIQKPHCGHAWPFKIQAIFPTRNLRLPHRVWQRIPRIAHQRRGKRPPVIPRNQNIF